MAESQDSTRAPANDDLTLLLGVNRLNGNVGRLADALRAFTTVGSDNLVPTLHRLVDDLIAALDAVEGDADVEPETDEATLGALEQHHSHVAAWQLTVSDVADDQEADDSDLEPDADGEPSLGSRERTSREYDDQTFWAASSVNDCEEDAGDECEIEECFEPWLGSFDRHLNQQDGWTARDGYGSDREADDADREANEPLLTECADGLEAFR